LVEESNGRDLIIFSLGPVQAFIARSRRTQDLWLSSRLLSQLARAGVETIASHKGIELLYPVEIRAGEFPDSIPNRFAALVPAEQGEAIARETEKTVQTAWKKLARSMRDHFAGKAPENNGWQSIWDRQVTSWLETYWVVWPWRDEEYGTAFRRAALALDARKRVRYFRPPEPGEKCTLCGEREVLHGTGSRRAEVRQFWKEIRDRPDVTGAELREGERLCAVCAIKRFGQSEPDIRRQLDIKTEERFPSTSSIAAATFRAGVLDHWDELERYVRAHLEALRDLNVGHRERPLPYLEAKATGMGAIAGDFVRYQGDLFYRSTFTEARLEEVVDGAVDREACETVLRTLTVLRDTAADCQVAAPHPYLAALSVDGDRMGKLLGAQKGPTDHRAVSQALAGFAENDVPRIVEQEHSGRVIYAGGDDILALLPVADALEAADAMRRAFTGVLGDTVRDPDQEPPTISAGIAIIHHTQPLESALQAARDALHIAKDEDRYNRNALVVQVLRRSGEPRLAGLNWSYQPGLSDALQPIKALKDAMAAGWLSGRFAYDLVDEAAALEGVPGAHVDELGRLLARHRADGLSAEQGQAIADLASPVAALAESAGIEEVSEWLLLARFLAQGGPE